MLDPGGANRPRSKISPARSIVTPADPPFQNSFFPPPSRTKETISTQRKTEKKIYENPMIVVDQQKKPSETPNEILQGGYLILEFIGAIWRRPC